MTNSKSTKGQCLCGSVHLSFEREKDSFDACHCGMCRKWGGSPIMTVHAKSNIKFTGEDLISVYNSSEWAERGFCKGCGTHLFYRLKQSGDHYFPLGLLENADNFKFTQQIFIDKKPKSYSFAEKTEQMTEAEVFAKFTSP